MRLLSIGLLFIVFASCNSSSDTTPNPPNPPNLPNPPNQPLPPGALSFCNAAERPMQVTNQSSKTIWVGFTSGTFFCRSNADCADSGGQCTFTNSDAQGNYGNCSCGSANNFSCGTLGSCSQKTLVPALPQQPQGTWQCQNKSDDSILSCKIDSDCSNANAGGHCTILPNNTTGICTCSNSGPQAGGCGTKYTCNSDKPYPLLYTCVNSIGRGVRCNTDTPCPSTTSKVVVCTYIDAAGDAVCSCSGAGDFCGADNTCDTTDPSSLIKQFYPPPPPPAYMCFWSPPRLLNAQTPKLAPRSSAQFCFPAPSNSQSKAHHQTNVLSQVQWSGNMFARFGCDDNGQNCASGQCTTNDSLCPNQNCGPGYKPPSGSTYDQECPNNGHCAPQNGYCNVGTGGNQPTTLAEFTFTAGSKSLDYYDVSIINGINLGVSMQPDLQTTVPDPKDPYFCATPGAKQQDDPLGVLQACSWKITPSIPGSEIPFIPGFGDQSTLLRQVLPASPTVSCSSDYSVCQTASGQICGLAQNVATIPSKQFAKVCGTLVGYWSADQLSTTIGLGKNTNPSPGDVPTALYGTHSSIYVPDYFGCTGTAATSCYQNTTSCNCGCPTLSGNPYIGSWPKVLESQGNCIATWQPWVSTVQPWLVFMKLACPTAYTFPFDDKTSTFTCNANSSGVTIGSAPGYTVTFFDTTYVAP